MNVGPEKPRSGKPPGRHDRRGFFRRLRRWWSNSWIVDWYSRLGDWLFKWWHPPSRRAYPSYEYHGRSHANRLSRAWGRLRHRIRNLGPARLFRTMLRRLHDWWYPPLKDAYPTYGGYGGGKRSRLAMARRRLHRLLMRSALARRCGEIYDRLYGWWYPVVDDPHSYYGHCWPKRKSRPVVIWGRFRRLVRNSWLGQRYRELLHRLYDWWYPPMEASAIDFTGRNRYSV